MVIRVEGLNWNCSQHITPRFSGAEPVEALEAVRACLAALEEENEALRSRLARRM